MLDTMNTKDMITVMKAHANGQEVECIHKDASHGNWQEVGSPIWDWRNYNYRI